MKKFHNATMLRIFISEGDKINGQPLFEEIVLKAKELCMSGVTVNRGIMGYGCHKQIHSAKVLRLAEELPIIIEIIDEHEKINEILPFIQENVKEGMITAEKLHILNAETTAVIQTQDYFPLALESLQAFLIFLDPDGNILQYDPLPEKFIGNYTETFLESKLKQPLANLFTTKYQKIISKNLVSAQTNGKSKTFKAKFSNSKNKVKVQIIKHSKQLLAVIKAKD